MLDAVDDSLTNDCASKNRVLKYMKLELLDLHTLIPMLNKYQLLTQNNMYDLKNPLVAPLERANALVYQILPSKGPGAFTLFVKCLQEEKEHMGHQTLARLFTLPNDVPETSPVQCEDKESIGKLFVPFMYYLCMFQLPNSSLLNCARLIVRSLYSTTYLKTRCV